MEKEPNKYDLRVYTTPLEVSMRQDWSVFVHTVMLGFEPKVVEDKIADWWIEKIISLLSEVESLPRYDVYDGGEALANDGDYIKYSDILSKVASLKNEIEK